MILVISGFAKEPIPELGGRPCEADANQPAAFGLLALHGLDGFLSTQDRSEDIDVEYRTNVFGAQLLYRALGSMHAGILQDISAFFHNTARAQQDEGGH